MTAGTATKMRTVKAVLIDATNGTITDVEIEPTLEKIYELVGCKYIEAVRWALPDHTIYVDEEGMLRPVEHWFSVNGQCLAGNGLVVGPPDADGDETSCSLTADEVRAVTRIYHTATSEVMPA